MPIKIKYKLGICKGGCSTTEKIIYNKSKGLCYYCNVKAMVKRQNDRRKMKIEKGLALDSNKLQSFYKSFYKQHPTKRCFETNEEILYFKSWNCHHLLEKHKYPHLAYNVDICVLLTLEQHRLWHDIDDEKRKELMPKTYEQYCKIKNKYNE